jgi:hypothetical protein
MALSNWDTLAINRDGHATTGDLTTPKGVVVEIYKNWIHITDNKTKFPDGAPLSFSIDHGKITYRDLNVYAERGPQDGVFLIAWWSDWQEAPEPKIIWDGIVAVGCYGFSGDEWIGVEEESVKFLSEMIERAHQEFVINDYMFASIDFTNAIRYNQGDAYFAQKGFVEGGIGTRVGEVEQPVMIQMLKNEKKDAEQEGNNSTT